MTLLIVYYQVLTVLDKPTIQYPTVMLVRPGKKMFVSCNGPKKNRVGRSEFLFSLFFCSKMCFMHVF